MTALPSRGASAAPVDPAGTARPSVPNPVPSSVPLPASPSPALSADAAWRALHEAACAPYRPVSRFAWHFARGKLGRDPVFRALVERGELAAAGHVVDIGCGQGLLACIKE